MKKSRADIIKRIFSNSRIIVLVLLCIFLTLSTKGRFFTYSNFVSILYSISLTGIMICGAVFPVLLGGIDRTVSGNAAVCGAMAATVALYFNQTTMGAVLALLCGTACGMISGLFHGIVLSRFAIPAFLLTLATNEVLYGIVQFITGNQLINVLYCEVMNQIGQSRFLGIPIPVYILLVCFAVCYLVLNHTVYGRQIYAVGGNRQASDLSGISTRRVIIIAYTISGFLGALSGFVLSCMNRQASAAQAQGYENDVLAAIVVGGVSLRGGEGTLQGAMLGAILIGIMTNGLRLLGIDSIYHNLIKGIIIIAAIAWDMLSAAVKSGTSKNPLAGLLVQKKLKKV
ncbi:MAG: ABC transporter permease [Lachnospiraceae bacterium]|nr:ABC transporter permease [Lachnospiraceae bacterium]MDY5700103.1 ABC transporter permease [Lachnospiraceae bacterium]